jgi:predicted membrane-bound spermidine synthase
MKALLRVILLLDAILQVIVGIVLLLAPMQSIYSALQLPQPAPALYGQMLGVLLIGLAWLLVRATFNGHLTAPVANVTGNVNLACAVLIIVWLVFFDLPVTGAGRIWLPILAALMALFAAIEIPASASVVRREKQARTERATYEAELAAANNPTATPVHPDPYRQDPVLMHDVAPLSADPTRPDHARQNPHS